MTPFAQGASVTGRAHARLGRNNQDGWAVRGGPAHQVAVVADGCGSRPRSEAGALLGAQFLAGWLTSRPLSEELPEQAAEALAGFLGRLARDLDQAHPGAALQAQLLFTFLALVREGPRVQVFGLGDGAVLVDGAWVRLDAGPDDAPDYCAYRLLSADGGPRARQHFLGEARLAAVMTDGLADLAPAATEALLLGGAAGWGNPYTLQRRLNVLHEAHPFSDDATLVVSGGG
jgi:hypothetical protein